MKHLFLLSLLFASLTLFADQQQIYIQQANKAYSVGSYTEAATLYKKVVLSGYESPDLYFNLGNTYFKLNDFANAILWYERAKRLDPGNEDLDFNLNVANNKIADKIEPLPELFYKRWINNVILMFPVDTWAGAAIVLFIIGLSAGILYLASRVLFLRKIGFWLGLTAIFLSLITLTIAWSGYHNLKNQNQAIIFTPTVTIKSSPDEKSVDLFVLHEGTRVDILDRIGNWLEIRIANGSVGWIQSGALEKI